MCIFGGDVMKKKKGFTIPELLAVLVILGILAIIGIVTVNRTKETQRQTYNMTQNTLFGETAKIYFQEHKDLLPKNLYESEYVTLEELVKDKYFDDYIKDYDKNRFSGNSKVKVTKIGENEYTYSPVLLNESGDVVVEKPDTPATITFDYRALPSLASDGKYYVNKTPYIDVTMTDSDVLKGYTYIVYKDGDVYKSSGTLPIESMVSYTETLTLDTKFHKDGEYKIKITTYDAEGHKKSKTSKVVVIDKIPPKCSLNVEGTSGLKGWYKTNVDLKLSVTEKNKTELKQGITTSTTVTYNGKTKDTQSDTKGKKWYGYVKDIAGNTGKCEKTVKVDTKKPVCTFSDPSVNFVITGEQATMNLTCSDETSLIDPDTMKFTLSNNIEISSASAKLVSITDPVVENNGSKYTIKFEGINYGNFKISLKANSISDNVGYKNDKTTSTNIESYNKAEIPNNSLCVSRTYNGSAQQLTSTTVGTGYKLSGYSQTNANEAGYTITATLDEGYRWSDKTNTTKTFKCPLHKATPVITLSATSGTIVAGNKTTFNEKANVKGKFSVTSNNTAKATVTQASSNEIAANTNNKVTIQGVVGATAGSAVITTNFVPTDTSNYNNASPKTYTVTVKKAYASNTVNGVTTYYEKLQEAINASPTGTVKLLDNVTENITINTGTNKTIDLNGKTINGSVTNNGQTTISNGTITGNVTNNKTETINNVNIGGSVTTGNGGSTTINGGKVNGNVTNNGGTTTTSNTDIGGSVTNNNGTTTIKDGTVSGDVTNNGGTTNLSDDTIGGSVTNDGTMKIEDTTIGDDLTNNGNLSGKDVTVGDQYNNNNSGGSSGGSGSNSGISDLETPNDNRTKITIPTTSICEARTYTGYSQRLTNKISDTGYVLSGYDQTNAGEYSITAALTDANQYKWADDAVNAKVVKCSMAKATPVLTIPTTEGTTYVGRTTYLTANIKSNTSVDAVGVVHLSSNNTTYATVQNDETKTATVSGISSGFAVYGRSSNGTSPSTATITVSFTPTDTTNYNKPEDKTFKITVKPLEWSATFYPNGAELTESTGCTKNTSTGVVTCKCTTSGSNTGCNLKAPKITRDDYTILGFHNNSNDKTSRLSSEGTLNMPNSTTFYAITKYDVVVTFNANGNTLTLDGKTATGTGSLTNSCTLYNTDSYCSMVTPKITGTTNTPNVPSNGAFQVSSTAFSYDGGVGHDTTAYAYKEGIPWFRSGSKSKTFYAFSYSNTSTYTADWNANGATLSSTTQSKCTTAPSWNGAAPNTSCTVDAPTITRSDYTIVGYNTSSSLTTNNSNYNTSTKKLTISSNTTWYAITKRQLSVSFSRNTTEVSSVGSSSGNCYIYNTETSCTPSSNTPTFAVNDGFKKLGYSTSQTGSVSTTLNENTSYSITTGNTNISNKVIKNGTTLYARGKYPVASEVGYNSSRAKIYDSNGNLCSDVQCALDALSRKITFSNQSISKTFSTSAQTASITPASGGYGSYKYSEFSEVNSKGNETSYISLSGTTITIAANTPSDTYTYRIRANDSNFASAIATYTISITDANPPTSVYISVSGTSSGQVTVSFGATDNVGIAGYRILYGTSASSMTVCENCTITTSSTSGTTTISGLTNGQIYYFKVRAYDTDGNYTDSSQVSKTINVYRYYRTSSSTGTTKVPTEMRTEVTGSKETYMTTVTYFQLYSVVRSNIYRSIYYSDIYTYKYSTSGLSDNFNFYFPNDKSSSTYLCIPFYNLMSLSYPLCQVTQRCDLVAGYLGRISCSITMSKFSLSSHMFSILYDRTVYYGTSTLYRTDTLYSTWTASHKNSSQNGLGYLSTSYKVE